MNNEVLDKLISLGCIVGYEYENVDDEGNVGIVSNGRNSERLTLYFKDTMLTLNTICSGSHENTEFIIGSNDN